MTGMARVGCTEEPLGSLLEHVDVGRIQIPEFQRELTLHDEWTKSLLASVSLGYPIGAITLLQTGSPDLRFEARPLPGVPAASAEPELLLIDGQQRMSSLYQVLASARVVQLHDEDGEPIRRWYYLDVDAALDPAADRDEAFISVPETRQAPHGDEMTADLSATEWEWGHGWFPLRLVFGAPDEMRRWQRGFIGHGSADDAKIREQTMSRLDREIVTAFHRYRLPTIVLGPETTRWSVRVHGGPDGRHLSDRYRTT